MSVLLSESSSIRAAAVLVDEAAMGSEFIRTQPNVGFVLPNEPVYKRPTAKWFTEGFDTLDLKEAKALLKTLMS